MTLGVAVKRKTGTSRRENRDGITLQKKILRK